MRPLRDGDLHFFVDESGDPTFFNKRGRLIVGEEGCSSHLMLGLIRIKNDPSDIRSQIVSLHQEVINDPYFKQLPSFKHTRIAFHANKDAPEVRYLVFRLISTLNFRFVFVVSQKDGKFFRERGGTPNSYYDYLVSRLFKGSLHRYERNHITIAKRGSRVRQQPLEAAIERARRWFDQGRNYSTNTDVRVTVQQPSGEPCLIVTDYIGWAIQRAYTTGDMKYYNVIADKLGLIMDLKARKRARCFNKKHSLIIE